MPLEDLSSLPMARSVHSSFTSASYGGRPLTPTLGESHGGRPLEMTRATVRSRQALKGAYGDMGDNPRQFTAIYKLPLMTQFQIMMEVEEDPDMGYHVRDLLAKDDPVKAVTMDQKKAVTHALNPAKFMEMAGKWPILQHYAKVSAATARDLKSRGMGQTPEEDNELFWQIYGYPEWDRSREKPVTDVSGMGFLLDLWNQYGKDALQKNKGEIAKVLGLEDEEKGGTDINKKIQELADKASAEQNTALRKTPDPDPQTKVTPPKKGLSKGAKIGIGVGAGVLGLLFVGGLIWLATRKKKK